MYTKLSRRRVLQAGIALALAPAWSRVSFAGNPDAAVPGRPVPPKSKFGKDSTAEEVTEGLDLSGKTVLVTGCNSGIGHETMRVLAMRGAHVLGAARTARKANLACASVDGRATPLVIELTDFDTIVAASDQVAAMDVKLDMLICNAGVMAIPQLEQAYGIEKQFVINHLGHFILVNRLFEQVVAAPQGRVVVVSSSAHQWAPDEGIQFDNLSGEEGYEPFEAYGQSKLANGLFARELARRFADSDATANSLHPGVIKTNLGRYLPQSDDDNESWYDKSIPQGAATSCYVATHPDLSEVTGHYFSDCNPAEPSPHMQDDEMAAKLWAVSEELADPYL